MKKDYRKTEIYELAKKIRLPNEKWQSAISRANKQLLLEKGKYKDR